MIFRKKEICPNCGNVEYSSQLGFYFHHDWDSFMFWKPLNWRNFTIIHLSIETNDYSKYLELEFGILGLNFNFDIYRKHYETKCSKCFKNYLESITIKYKDDDGKK